MKYLKKYKLFEYGEGKYAEYDNDNGEEFWGNVAAGVLPYCKETKRFLINFRSEEVNEPHTWGIWGGKLDNDENIEDAVIREFEEESQYSDNIELISAYVFQNPNGDFKYYNFIGIIENEFTPVLDWESEDFKWVTEDELYNHEDMHFGLEGLLNDTKTKKIIEKL